MVRRLFIHAANVHHGGGRVLLAALLRHLPSNIQSMCLLDRRMPLPEMLGEGTQMKHISPSIWQRFRAERQLSRDVMRDDVVVCFGNLPPIFKSRGYVSVFLQNRYLVEDVSLSSFPLKVRLRLMMERFWFSVTISHANEFVVQTPSMRDLLYARIQGRAPIKILPFVSDPSIYQRKISVPRTRKGSDISFLYVASGEPHKNHLCLVDAWCLLAKEGLFPALTITLDTVLFAEICAQIDKKVSEYKLNIRNVGSVPHKQIDSLYAQSTALIYPSTFESFGLPLIEARMAGLPILASELDYVRDILEPEQSFDPKSPVSIARAVKRFGEVDEPTFPLLGANEFLTDILKSAQ